MLTRQNPDRLVIEACQRVQSLSAVGGAGSALYEGDIRFSFLQEPDVFDRTRRRSHGDVDAFAREQGLIAQSKKKVRSAFARGRENDMADRCRLNEMVGSNEPGE